MYIGDDDNSLSESGGQPTHSAADIEEPGPSHTSHETDNTGSRYRSLPEEPDEDVRASEEAVLEAEMEVVGMDDRTV